MEHGDASRKTGVTEDAPCEIESRKRKRALFCSKEVVVSKERLSFWQGGHTPVLIPEDGDQGHAHVYYSVSRDDVLYDEIGDSDPAQALTTMMEDVDEYLTLLGERGRYRVHEDDYDYLDGHVFVYHKDAILDEERSNGFVTGKSIGENKRYMIKGRVRLRSEKKRRKLQSARDEKRDGEN